MRNLIEDNVRDLTMKIVTCKIVEYLASFSTRIMNFSLFLLGGFVQEFILCD